MAVDPALAMLAGWESFYVIIGSSSAALTGLNFVVIALGADARALAGPDAVSVFATPTIVHFSVVLLAAAIVSAPWPSITPAAWCLAACGSGGVLYVGWVIRGARRSIRYRPVLEDWIFHGVLPAIAYLVLLVAAIRLPAYSRQSLFLIAGVSLLLMFIGIHNAWDAATYMALNRSPRHGELGSPGTSPAGPDHSESLPGQAANQPTRES